MVHRTAHRTVHQTAHRTVNQTGHLTVHQTARLLVLQVTHPDLPSAEGTDLTAEVSLDKDLHTADRPKDPLDRTEEDIPDRLDLQDRQDRQDRREELLLRAETLTITTSG
jgi:hypothetical protein